MAADPPRVERMPIGLPRLGRPLDVLWDVLVELADRLSGVAWTVVGGQMVLLHALERGTVPPRVSSDIDAVVDVRVDPGGVHVLVGVLHGLGFEAAGAGRDGHVHRFERSAESGPVVVDVLVPEGLGDRIDTITVPPGTAFPAPGTSQALARTELVPIRHGEVVAWIPRPSLPGAVVAKAVAAVSDTQGRERHCRDLAFLVGLVEDPIETRAGLDAKDRRRLRSANRLLVAADDRWWSDAEEPDQARAAWRLLLGPEPTV